MSDDKNDPRIAPERMQLIGGMVKKLANHALSGASGSHFRAYPPSQVVNNPKILEESDLFTKLKETVWWVRWYDDRYDQLSFLEFIGFVYQIVQARQAFAAAQE